MHLSPPARQMTMILLAALWSYATAMADNPSRMPNDEFSRPSLDLTKWSPTGGGACAASTVKPEDGRLRIGIDTRGDSDEVVYRGIRSVHPIPLLDCDKISVEIDWNNQGNCCYLEAALYLSPEKSDTTPEAGKNWWKLSYIGVPPGQLGRGWSSLQLNGGERVLYNEGWPQQSAGRPLGKQRVLIRRSDAEFEVLENGRRLFTVPVSAIPFAQAYLYLQVSSHSNYPPRDIFFDNSRFQTTQ